MKQHIINEDRWFCDMMPRQRLDELNELLCGRFGAPPGTEIPFWDTRPIEQCGAVYWAYMEAAWEQKSLVFNMMFLNASGQMRYREDRRLKCEEIELGNVA